MHMVNVITKFVINLFAFLVLVLLYAIHLTNFAIAIVSVMAILYTAEYMENKLTDL